MAMYLNEYQQQAMTTDFFNGEMQVVTDPAFMAKLLGLVGEAGEVAEKFKKIIRDKNSIISDEDKKEIIKELGDVLWYIATLAHYMGTPLEDIASMNLAKLASRKERGVSHGNGDNR